MEASESVRAVAMDVERLPSDDPTARSVTMVEALKRILVTHAIGTRRGYRQGMHEVASAVLLCCASAAEAGGGHEWVTRKLGTRCGTLFVTA